MAIENAISITVPAGTKYLSNLKNENGTSFELPNGILNKGLTGCGGTTLALTDSNPTIITSPRKKLMSNKKKQGFDNLLVVDGDVYDSEIEEFLNNCTGVPKIFVTYDSFWRVKKCIGNEIYNWRMVLDEFHCLQTDASYKSETIISFMHQIQDMPYVTYLSATPIHSKYLQEIPELCDKPIYTLEWEEKPEVLVARWMVGSPMAKVEEVIKQYKDGFSFCKKDENGNVLKCHELVFFINSVSDIINIIANTGLTKDEVNIIIADNAENNLIVQKLGEDFAIGDIPLKGEPHKMFTFCTSTAYFGVDMYSDNACSIVVSNIHKNSTSVDIVTELPQIAGRQRNEANPFRNNILLIYNTSYNADIEEFKKIIDLRWEWSMSHLDFCRNYSGDEELLKKMIADDQKINKFKNHYVFYDNYLHKFSLNKIKYLADLNRCSAQYEYYKNIKYLDEQLKENGFTLSKNARQWMDNVSFVKTITCNDFSEKLKTYCEVRDSDNFLFKSYAKNVAGQKYKDEFELYYETLGTEKIKSLEYKEELVKDEWNLVNSHDAILAEVVKTYIVNTTLTIPEIKNKFYEILKDLGIGISQSMTKPKIAERYGIEFKETSGGFYENGKSITVHRVIGVPQLPKIAV